MRYFPLFNRIDIVLDQCPYKSIKLKKKSKLIQGSFTTQNNIYRATSTLFFYFFKFKASPEGIKIKKQGKRLGVGCVQSPWTAYFWESNLLA